MNVWTNKHVIKKYLDLSSSHVSSKDLHTLEQEFADREPRIQGHEFPWGFMIWVPIKSKPDDPIVDRQSYYDDYKVLGLSDAFINLLKLAATKKCTLICLTQDGEEEPSLPRFNH